MTTLYGSLKLRPTRIGFLVDPTSLDNVRRIMQVCTCLWGGLYNPIIPVCNELPEQWRDRERSPQRLTENYLRFFEPDVFVECQPGLAAAAGVAGRTLDFGKPTAVPLDAFFTASAEDDADIPWGLKIIALYRDLYEREFKFVARDSNRVALFEDDPAADAFIEAAFGAFPRTGFLAPLRDAYVQAFAPKNMPPTAASWRTVFDDRYRFPLSFTFTALRSDGTDLRMRFRTRARAEIVQQQMISNACRQMSSR